MDNRYKQMEYRKIKIGVICFDLQNFTTDFLNRLQMQLNEVAFVKAYPIMDNIGDIGLMFKYEAGENVTKHKVKTYSDNKKHTPEGILLTPNSHNAIKCAIESDLILHYGIHSSTALITGFIGFILGKRQISVNQTLPIFWERKRKWWIRWNKFIFFKFCYLHIAQSKVTLPNLKDYYKIKESKIRYIPFEAGIHAFREKFNMISDKNDNSNLQNSNTFKFLFVGNLVRFKGLFLAIDAVNIIKKKKKIDILLSIVGPETIEKSEPKIPDIQLYVKELGLENSVEVLGSKSLDQLVSIYNQSDVFILPTMKDCFPKVLVEAGIAGKPMITSDASGAVNTIVIDGINGYICKAGSVEDLALCMEKIANRDVINKMAAETKNIIDQYLIDTQNEAELFKKVILETIK